MALITGNTYPVREAIKALGGRWVKSAQGWDVPTEKADEARALVAGAGEDLRAFDRGVRRGQKLYRRGSGYTRFAGGAEVFTNAKGRCEDAPCCGCCS